MDRQYEAKDILQTIKVAGKNGQQILKNDVRRSPVDRIMMSLEQVRGVVKSGFFVWTVPIDPRTESSIYLNIRNVDTEIEKLVVKYNKEHAY